MKLVHFSRQFSAKKCKQQEDEFVIAYLITCKLEHNMDVSNSNCSNVRSLRSTKTVINTTKVSKFCIGTYFIWFSALIFVTELVTDFCLVVYYIHEQELRWGLITLAIIILPSMLCQLYSLLMLRTHKTIKSTHLIIHFLLMGIPYRYQSLLRRIDKDKASSQEFEYIKQSVRELNTLQTINAFLEYLPQFLFQAYLIIFKKYKCVITGVSAGLAAFSFIWHVFLHIYYCARRFNMNSNMGNEPTPRIIDNLSLSNEATQNLSSAGSDGTFRPFERSKLTENIKIFEKQMYKTDDKNLVSKKQSLKSMEKTKIFSFNKRKALYETEDFDLYDYNNLSTVFFEINDSTNSEHEINLSTGSKKVEDFHNENNSNLAISYKDVEVDGSKKSGNVERVPENRMLKRKGICSSQEMLHLVDVMNDISAEQVDVLAKSLIEMGGDESLKADSEEADNSRLLEKFPDFIDDKLKENIEAAIYENQVIFQERIRKNQLTIQNLKLQDQLLSKYIEEIKNLPSSAMINIRDYENMCFANVSRQNRLKHWRNYLHDIDSHVHDDSTIQHSSFYVNTNTLSNSLTDLYVNETEISSIGTENEKLSELSTGDTINKKNVHWDHKSTKENDTSLDGNMSDRLYINMTGPISFLPRKNLLVETISTINVDSPISHSKSLKILPDSIIEINDK